MEEASATSAATLSSAKDGSRRSTGCLLRPNLYEGKTQRTFDLSLPMPQQLDWQTRQTYSSITRRAKSAGS